MRAAAILGLGASERDLQPFRTDPATTWTVGMPAGSEAADAVLLFGGDGTLHRHLPQLARLKLPVLVVPAGSGNDFARALNIRSVANSVAAWRNFERGADNMRHIDLGTITRLREPPVSFQRSALSIQYSVLGTRYYFACVASCGLDAAIAQRANRLPRWLRAHGGYTLSLPGALFSTRALDVQTLTAHAGSGFHSFYSGPTTLVACANTPVYGGGVRIAPRADLTDGRLDVCHIRAISRAKLLTVFPTAYFGRHLGISEVEYFQADKVRLVSDLPTSIYADGEYVCETPVEIGIEPGALTVIVA